MMFNAFHGMWNYWLFGIIIMLFIAIYVANDAIQFGQNGLMWALLVLFMPMMGLIIYLVVRSTWTIQQGNQRPVDLGTNVRTSPPRREQVSYSKGNVSENYSKDTKSFDLNDSQYCTVCGQENSISATFCNKCGAKIHSLGE